MKSSAFIFVIGLFSLLAGVSVHANDLVKEATITTTPPKAAVFRIDKGKRELLGYSPLAIKFEFPSEQRTHSILLAKIGYELARETIRIDSLTPHITLKKRDLFAASTPQNEAVHNQVKRRLQEDIYERNRFDSRNNVTGQIHVLPVNNAYSVGLEVLLFEDEILQKLRKHMRGGRSIAKQTALAQDVFDYSKELLRQVTESVKEIKAVRFIDLTVNFPIPQAELQFSREEIPHYSVNRYTTYYPDKTVTVTISGWTYHIVDTTDVYWRERTDALKFILPVDKLPTQGKMSIGTLKDNLVILLRERRDKQFVKIDLDDEGKADR